MDYKSIYETLCKRGKKRRTKTAYWGSWHRHHIIPKHVGGDNAGCNLTTLQVKEHALAHFLLYKLHRRQEDYVAYKCLRNNLVDVWAIPAYREFMLPKVLLNLSTVDRELAGRRAGEVMRPRLKETIHSPEVRAKSIAGRHRYVHQNPHLAAAQASVTHTTACWDKMSVTKTKAYPVGPDGTVYQSIRQAAQVTGIKRSNIDNWIRREQYGWSKRLVGTGEV